MDRLDELREAFATVREFKKSPLYTALGPVVANNDRLLKLVQRRRPGQYPTFLFFGAIHYLLLGGVEHELADFYPSLVGDLARPPRDVAPALLEFCDQYEQELAAVIESRLVQTNSVRRSLGLRLGFAALGHLDRAVHLIEIGASAGLNLRFNRYGYRLDGREFGNAGSPVQIESDWRGPPAAPDLDAVPPLASAIGVDLNPLDARDEGDRRWLAALVWPDNRTEAELLANSLPVAAAEPPDVRAGNAIDICPMLAKELPADELRLVFLAATRMHVPSEERESFDSGVATLGQNAPLYILTLERPPAPDPRPQPAPVGVALYLHDPAGEERLLAVVDQRQEWVEPVELGQR